MARPLSTLARAALGAMLIMHGATAASAQVAAAREPAAPVVSMGQPARWQWYGAGTALVSRGVDAPAASLAAGVHHPLLNPVTGLLGASAEGYGTVGGPFSGVGVRALATAPALALGAGADWNVSAGRVDFLLSYQTAILRGGLIGGGSMLRVDWLPTRGRSVGVGLRMPLGQPFAGRTRPRHTTGRLPADVERRAGDASTANAVPAALLDSLARAASLLGVYGSLYSDDEMRTARDGASYVEAMRSYHGALERAFSAAVRDSALGAAITRRARAGALEGLLLPYDALFGQVKDDVLSTLSTGTAAGFSRWVRDSSAVAPGAQAAVSAVHARWLDVIRRVHDDRGAQWRDSRAVWIPLTLALTLSEFDEQTEVDSLLARAVRRPFTDGNALTLMGSSDLPLEIARSIYAARAYHVLWTHDFAGRREETGAIDNVSYEMVADAYFPALTAAVKRYDSTGRLPTYMIFIDQFFYEPRDGRLWMTMLEDPLGAAMHLPGDTTAAREAHLRERQAELRSAVAASARLQADAARAGGDRWLSQMVKVHVSVPYPSDFSFRSRRIIPPIPFTPDNVMRDHRKIAIYDLDEADPFRGAMFLMGVGIGEHYASATWEDRGYRIRGPAALEARGALRRLLRDNGFGDDEIPPPLREVTAKAAVERRMNVGDYVGRALQVHNEVGFGAKESSVARALLYDLALPGSVIVVPDPLWASDEWAAMLAGAAARGARVYVIAPALENAPSPQAPLMALAHDVMQRLLEVRAGLGDRITSAGGELRIGLFAARAHVDDAAGRRREVQEGLRRTPWIRELIPFDAAALAVLDRAEAQNAADAHEGTEMARDVKARPPQLHQKTQIIARPGAIAAFVRQPGWEDALARAMSSQSGETARFAAQLGFETPDIEDAATRSTDALLLGYQRAISEADRKRVSFYYTLGTHNMDPRGIMLDGETTLVVSGIPAAAGLVDEYYLMARTTWVSTSEELDQLLPPQSGWMRRLGRIARPVF